jgi:hypothetical protein
MSSLSPVGFIQRGAAEYTDAHGLAVPNINFSQIVADPGLGRRIAAAYEAAPQFDRNATPAYRTFIWETVRQFQFLTRPIDHGGLGVVVVIWSRDPYPGARAMLAELRERRRLRIYSTAACGNPHPYLTDHQNDMFRAVHDAFGHAATGSGFDADGKEAAWLVHSHMYSPLARRALTTETRGQQAALLYGSQDGFAPQKCCLLPAEFTDLDSATSR